jgi:hypothetical protein
MRSNLDQLGYAGKQMWITEVGVDADYSANDSGAIDEERQRADLANTWSTVRHYCDDFNITLAVFWNLVDPDAYPPQGSARYYAGFMRAGYLSKAAYTVFANNDVLGPAYRSCY